MLEKESEVSSLLDPRTKLLLVLTVATAVIGGSNLGVFGLAKHLLSAIPFLLFLLEGKKKTAAWYGIAYVLAVLGEQLLLTRTYGLLNFILVAVFMAVTRFMPGLAMGKYLVTTTTVSAFMAAMEKLRLPQAVTIPLAVTFRFFPTIGEEYGAISRAMGIRGVRFGGGKPAKMLEYRLIPVILSCMNISEELSAAALTRGLGRPGKRTNICQLGFSWLDGLCIGICAAAWAMLLWSLLRGVSL